MRSPPEEHKWKPGQSGNPAGRPKGARAVLAESFLSALQKDFALNGIQAIETMRMTHPAEYVRVIASILPKQLEGEDGSSIAVGVVIFKGLNDANPE